MTKELIIRGSVALLSIIVVIALTGASAAGCFPLQSPFLVKGLTGVPATGSAGVFIQLAGEGPGAVETWRLDSVILPANASAAARKLLSSLLTEVDAQVVSVLAREDSVPDRRGRQAGDISGDGQTLAHQLVRRGAVLATGSGCSGDLLEAEMEARRDQQGFWAMGLYPLDAAHPAIDMPEFAVISGRVQSVGRAGSLVYLDFGQDHATDMSIRIPSSVVSDLDRRGIDPMSLAGAEVEARGMVVDHFGPEMDLADASLLRVIAFADRGQ